jgi:hypothetical protein
MNDEPLKRFRQEAYQLLGAAQAATMDLMDAVLVTRSVNSLAELSMSPMFRRKWPSVYEALEDCRPQREELMQLYIKQIPREERIILAGDHTAWPRLYADTLKDRTYEQGAFQLRQACHELEVRPLSLWDSEYGCARFIKMTVDIPADKMMRLRPNRCLWTEPPPYQHKGRPRKHGQKFQLANPDSWLTPDEVKQIDDPVWGQVELKRWRGLHFRATADVPMDIILIQRQGTKLTSSGGQTDLVGLCNRRDAQSRSHLVDLSTTLCHRPLEPLRQAKTSLDETPTFYT